MSKYWEKIAVIGAAGKMGKGISLLLLQEMACQDAERNSSVGKNGYRLVLVDQDEKTLFSLRQYFRPHLTRFAEKSINDLRSFFCDREDLISNEQIINEFVKGALGIIRPSTSLDTVKHSSLVFEAIVEDVEAKINVLTQLNQICSSDTFYLTNTSSIPITQLGKQSGLNGRLVGAHFYNPPPVQKLLEMIYPANVDPELKDLSLKIGKRLKKKVVASKDVAGFIGNGHFIREIAFACDLYDRLRKKHSHVDSVLMVDAITRDFLIRPMGIFQLLDYVGLDVWKKIATVMGEAFPEENFSRPLLEEMIARKRIGGQEIDGSQRAGFFDYRKGKIIAVYNLETDAYEELTEEKQKTIRELLGPFPERHRPWKEMVKVIDHEAEIECYEDELGESSSPGAELAREHLTYSRKIAQKLVDDHVVSSMDDMKTVLKNGFYQVLV
ncbi:MAG: putative 3-hydroxybutyryl-CoA dehydrogenase [Chlamydiae bacterium]|nr:putative 3-hydroxybutyryl-CoA dehydrogenase [Chlamydiota bacterium]